MKKKIKSVETVVRVNEDKCFLPDACILIERDGITGISLANLLKIGDVILDEKPERRGPKKKRTSKIDKAAEKLADTYMGANWDENVVGVGHEDEALTLHVVKKGRKKYPKAFEGFRLQILETGKIVAEPARRPKK